MDDGGSEGEFLLHAVREVGDEFFCFVGEAHELEELGGTGGGGSGVEAVHAADEAEVLGAVRRPKRARPSGTTPICRLTSMG